MHGPTLKLYISLIVFLPLISAIIVGFHGKHIKNFGVNLVSLLLIGATTTLSIKLFIDFYLNNQGPINTDLYIWAKVGNAKLTVGFLVDKLAALMLVIVSFISFIVHLYSIGYMKGDPGYYRFFSYISLFTFAMLMLVTANNFLQLFFGWELCGLLSYLLIGFWFKRKTAIFASLKAFLVNRIGDIGLILGICAIYMYFGTLNYSEVFNNSKYVFLANQKIALLPHLDFSVINFICFCLFIGAMGKSAQVPLHVWLPDSMEGPTPISALIHAATMVAAGVFLVVRMSPLFEYSEAALNFVMIIGTITCFFMGILSIVQNDIKRIIAYSTLSQLGYMMMAVGASAYSIAMFHLFTHSFIKALLFLAAGSVILAMQKEHNIRKMGNLKYYMPVTFITIFIGGASLVGFPGLSGFFSKDLIIEALHASNLAFANIAYIIALIGVFITAIYIFRLIFLVFYNHEKMDDYVKENLKEPSALIYIPLILLAIPSIVIGWYFIDDIFSENLLPGISVLSKHNVLPLLSFKYLSAFDFVADRFFSLTTIFMIAGIITAWLCYIKFKNLPSKIIKAINPIYIMLINKYWFDSINEKIIVPCVRGVSCFSWKFIDEKLIDKYCVEGTYNTVAKLSGLIRKMQTGYLLHYLLIIMSMVIIFVFLTWV